MSFGQNNRYPDRRAGMRISGNLMPVKKRNLAIRAHGRVPEYPGEPFWEEAVSFLPRFSTPPERDQLESPPIAPVELLKMECSPCAGYNYHLTIRVFGEDGYTYIYYASVWRKLFDLGMELCKIELIAKEKTTGIEIPDDSVEGGTRVIAGQRRIKVLTSAFNHFLKHFRSKRPKMSYARAKKSAAIAWKKLPDSEKIEFLRMGAECLDQENAECLDQENEA